MSELVGINPEKSALQSPESRKQAVFEIRGHRLHTFLFQPRLFQENGLQWVSNKIRRNNQRMRHLMLYEDGYEPGYGDSMDYFSDILGENPTVPTIRRINAETIAFMATFLALSENAQIRLTRKPDGICSTCVIGNHCTNRSNEMNPNKLYESGDADAMQEFITVAEWIGAKEGKNFTVKRHQQWRYDNIINLTTDKTMLTAVVNNMDKHRKWKEEQEELAY